MFADNFLHDDFYYQSQIEQILGHVVSCHNLMLIDNEPIAYLPVQVHQDYI